MSLMIHVNPMLNISSEDLKIFCQKNHIRKLSLFGSMKQGNLKTDSDIDILVEFYPGSEPGLIELADMEFQLEEHFGREVDMRTPEDLSEFFRHEVISAAEVLYEEK